MGAIIKNGVCYSAGGNSVDTASILNERVLTQAEYDALPDSKLTDGVNYYITDTDPEPYPIPELSSKSVELTQAEYDALPDTKLTDNVTYYITDGKDAVSSFVLGGAS